MNRRIPTTCGDTRKGGDKEADVIFAELVSHQRLKLQMFQPSTCTLI